ncbi:hypothetical protein THARTR1_07753 [Trichoderma harzianum]|uniref:Uncharacterized protein n=1 Tax=Trichoderma harzianum TaxID=5544 RepID=A0A2K0U1I4_TRIHA|nr:hypothetical protein THARTR1_07753 [Trichoderma harzianum]
MLAFLTRTLPFHPPLNYSIPIISHILPSLDKTEAEDEENVGENAADKGGLKDDDLLINEFLCRLL